MDVALGRLLIEITTNHDFSALELKGKLKVAPRADIDFLQLQSRQEFGRRVILAFFLVQLSKQFPS